METTTPPTSTPDPAAVLRVMTWNIRNSHADDGPNAWTRRRDLVAAAVTGFSPDVLGLQEVMPDQEAFLRRAWPDHQARASPRTPDDPAEAQEAKLIAWRRDRFDPLACGRFWLSTTPDRPGGHDWDAKHTRWAEWVRLRDRVSGRELVVFNTHFDQVGPKARQESARLLRARVVMLARGEAAVVVGDFNCRAPAAPPFAALTGAEAGSGEGLQLRDAWGTLNPGSDRDASFNGFGKAEKEFGRIDWLLHTSHLETVESDIVRSRGPADGGIAAPYPSDHDPVQAVLRWREE